VRPAEVRALTGENLAKELESAYKELQSLRFRAATKQLPNTSELRKARVKLARLLTIKRQRQLLLEAQRSASGERKA
jgi:large subunit ribosomal protein L29